MSTESALRAAIIANPDEDTPRLVYADWLDEHADALPGRNPKEVRARAEFIRAQIAIEGRDGDPDFDDARDRASVLWIEYGRLWQPEPPHEPPVGGWVFYRGFAEHPPCGLQRFPQFADGLFAREPVRRLTDSVSDRSVAYPQLQRIRSLHLSVTAGATRDDLKRLLHSPHLAGLRELKFEWLKGLADDALELGAGSGPLAALESLFCGPGVLNPVGVAALARSKRLRLRQLTGFASPCGDPEVAALAASPVVSRLELLRLGACAIGSPGALALAASPFLGPLWHLDLSGNRIGSAGAEALAHCPRLANVRVLGLNFAQPGLEALEALGTSEHLANVRRLQLKWCRLRPGAGAILAGAPAFAELRALDLASNPLGDAGAQGLASGAPFVHVKRLDLSGCSIKAPGAKALAETDGFRALTHLSLGNNRFEDAGAKAFAAAADFPNLRVLALNNNRIADAGVIALARSRQMETVEILDLSANQIGDAGAKALMESKHFKRLSFLSAERNKMSRAVKVAFKKRFARPSE